MASRLDGADIGVVAAYFVLVLTVGLFASCRARRGSVSGFFLAGRQMSFCLVGASLFVSNIGSEHFIGLAGSGAAGGIGVGAWELNAILLLQLLGFVFVPIYIACKICTLPEYVSKRFGGQRIRVYLAFLSLILYIFTKCSVDLYTGAVFIQQSLGWDLYISIFALIAIVSLLTITGGLTAVIYTDTLQAILMVGGALWLMAEGFSVLGGFEGLWQLYPHSVTNFTVPNTTCHEVSSKWNVMLRESDDPDLPWPGFLFGQTPGSIWYWCSDQVIVQRVLAAKSVSHAQAATIMAALIKTMPLFIMVMPGMMSRVLYPDEVACVDPDICYQTCQSYAGCTNIAYPRLVLGIMPSGARGLIMAVLIAALMSDLDSIFNSASSLFTIDIYQRFRKRATVKELMIVGRIFIVIMTGIAIAWVPVVKETQGGQVFIYIQEVTNYLAPPVACVYLMAVLWPRCNEQGAFWGLMAGFVTGVTRLILIFVYPAPDRCGQEDTRPTILRDIHYMYFAMVLFWVTFIVTLVVSIITQPPSYDKLYRTTFWTRYDDEDLDAVKSGGIKAVWGRCMYSVKSSNPAQTFDNPAMVDDGEDRPGGVEAGNAEKNNQACDEGTKQTFSGSTQTDVDDSTSCMSRLGAFLMNWLCGVSDETSDDSADDVKREEIICSLQQDPCVKVLLYVMMVFVLLLGTGLYIFWSVWKYEVVVEGQSD